MSNKEEEKRIRLSSGEYLDPFIENILLGRGVVGGEIIKTFLEPKLKDLPDPFLMKDMSIAVQLVESAIINGSQILIWGDYDVDGTTATALLILFFKSIGVNADYHVPNRLTDGYGLQKDGLQKVAEEGEAQDTLLITVDNGISANEAVEYAKSLGYKVIVTDHHLPPENRIQADAVINPSQETCDFPDKTLAGVGVAFYLAMATRAHLSRNGYFTASLKEPNLKQLLDLVAVGTVADMVPLKEINRILVKAGMEVLAKQGNVGLTALCRRNNLDPGFIRSEDISFQLAPKINAAGRLGQADKAVRLLITLGRSEAAAIAKDLTGMNTKRKNINISDFAKAKDEVNGTKNKDVYSTVVSGSYHVGVAGIVASSLVGEYQRPSIVLCDCGGGILKGSGRSIPGVDLHRALDECKELLLGFGGHKMAGGLSMSHENLNKFIGMFDRAVKEQTLACGHQVADQVDADMEIAKLFTRGILRQLHLMEPFGQGNPQPIFRDCFTKFVEVARLGKDKSHLRVSFKNGSNATIKGVAFGMGNLMEDCQTKQEREILYTPSVNFFKGKRSWQVRVTNIRFGQQ